MNCQNFEKMIDDLARDRMMVSTSREQALRHVESCAVCKSRLRDERALTAGLRALAASDDGACATEKVTPPLLAAFREHNAAASVRAAAPSVEPVANARQWARWAVAVAAMIVIMISLVALLSKQEQPMVEAHKDGSNGVEQPKPGAAKSGPGLDNSAPHVAQYKEKKVDRPVARAGKHKPGQDTLNRPKPQAPQSIQASSGDGEVATDFLPMTYDNNLSQIEGGQVVRVELPRSALVKFGLPMNLERADERITADVVVGHDGLARAIRFVR
jgi:hypothetical protein